MLGAMLARLGCSCHGGVEGREVAHHALVLSLLVCMDGLGMLTEVDRTRKLFPTVTGGVAFSSVFPGQNNAKNRAADVIRSVLIC